MKTEQPSLFEVHKWHGEFFLPNKLESRFWGEIEYTPENGVKFTYSIIGYEIPEQTEILHGVLNTGERCTLIGKFTAALSNSCICNGQYTRGGNTSFQCLLIGDFVEKDTLFKNFRFSLPPTQNPLFADIEKGIEKYTETPIVCAPTPYGRVKITHSVNFILTSNIITQIYSLNKEALNELEHALIEIRQKHPNADFSIQKEKIDYLVNLELDTGSNILDAYSHINDITNLFALLIYRPVHPYKIQIVKEPSESSHRTIIEVYPTLFIDKRTITLCQTELFQNHLPITRSNVDLAALIQEWLKVSKGFATIISSLQHETGYRTEHLSHGELVLYATQFESISHKDKITDRKYEHPLKSYASEQLRCIISDIFERAGQSDVGKGISDLRNDIAHVGRQPKLLPALSHRDLMTISRVMHLTIMRYILRTLGISEELVSTYQDQLT